ncbi:hypothetical protein [Peterkaempfera sp. SMS 1(5)a]|uniref:hypothetical protein n=1 Tax=Peterkaempfera podocarpi TaxID=3232308 RepID=UPI00366A918E
MAWSCEWRRTALKGLFIDRLLGPPWTLCPVTPMHPPGPSPPRARLNRLLFTHCDNLREKDTALLRERRAACPEMTELAELPLPPMTEQSR